MEKHHELCTILQMMPEQSCVVVACSLCSSSSAACLHPLLAFYS